MNGEDFPDIDAPWIYPELHFGFGNAEFTPGDDPVILVQDVLSSLSIMEGYTLSEMYPDGFPEQPPYLYNRNKLERIDKFLKETATVPKSDLTLRKEDIVDLSKASSTILDSLARYNHPVVQALTAMHNDFAGLVPPQTLDLVTVEVLKQTHWSSLKDLLTIQVAVWRIDHSL